MEIRGELAACERKKKRTRNAPWERGGVEFIVDKRRANGVCQQERKKEKKKEAQKEEYTFVHSDF